MTAVGLFCGLFRGERKLEDPVRLSDRSDLSDESDLSDGSDEMDRMDEMDGAHGNGKYQRGTS